MSVTTEMLSVFHKQDDIVDLFYIYIIFCDGI